METSSQSKYCSFLFGNQPFKILSLLFCHFTEHCQDLYFVIPTLEFVCSFKLWAQCLQFGNILSHYFLPYSSSLVSVCSPQSSASVCVWELLVPSSRPLPFLSLFIVLISRCCAVHHFPRSIFQVTDLLSGCVQSVVKPSIEFFIYFVIPRMLHIFSSLSNLPFKK